MKYGILLLAIVLVLMIAYVIKCYNEFVGMRNRMKNQEAQVHVQLKQRCDLVPSLVAVVKGHAGFEKETLEAVITARSRVVAGKSDEAENELEHALGRLMAVSERYPELKASAAFMDLQKQLVEIEDRIAKARQFYNDTILKYNNAIQIFPANIAAAITGFKPVQTVLISEKEQEPVKVEF